MVKTFVQENTAFVSSLLVYFDNKYV